MAANLPMFDVGLAPSPGQGHRVPYFFPVYTKESNAEMKSDSRFAAELVSGKVFAVSDGMVVGYPDQPVGKWREETKYYRTLYYVGLSRSPRSGTPAPYFTPIYGSSTGEDTSDLKCDVFSKKAYAIDENGDALGYPEYPVGDCVDGFPPAVDNGAAAGAGGLLPPSMSGGNKNLPNYNAGFLIPTNGSQTTAATFFEMPKYNDVVAEYQSGLVFKKGANGKVIGFPDQPVGRWRKEYVHDPEYNGAPPSARKGGLGRKASRRTHRRRSNRRRTNRRAGRR